LEQPEEYRKKKEKDPLSEKQPVKRDLRFEKKTAKQTHNITRN